MLMVATIARTLERFMPAHVAALRERGWQIDAAACGIEGSGAARTLFDRVWEVGWSRRPLAVSNVAALGRIRAVVEEGRYQIVHVQTPVAAFVTRAAIRGLRDRPALVYTAHGFHFHAGAGWLRNAAYRTLERMAAPWTDELVVVNAEDRSAALALPLARPEHIHLVPGVGIDTHRFDPAQVSAEAVVAARRQFGLPDGAPMVLTIAEMNRNKNLGFLLAALARARPETHAVLVGDGPERSNVERQITRLGLSGRVHLVRYVEDIRPLFGAASVFVLGSRREGLPGAMIEAMSMERPVVGSDVRGIRDLAAGGRGIVVPLGRPDRLASAIERVLEDRRDATAMARRAREYVVAELSVERVLSGYRDVYQVALTRRRPAA